MDKNNWIIGAMLFFAILLSGPLAESAAETTCPTCDGTRTVLADCSSCGGTGDATCGMCDGTGEGMYKEPCHGPCGGTGTIPGSCWTCWGDREVTITCPTCGGTEATVDTATTKKPCTDCGGTGDATCGMCDGTGKGMYGKPCRGPCGGTGTIPGSCWTCGGDGEIDP